MTNTDTLKELLKCYVRRSESDWRHLIQEWKQSGQSQAVFCASRGLALSSLCNWRRKLKSESVSSSGSPPREAAGFIELTAPMASEKESPAWDVELSLGEGTVLRLRCTHAHGR
ncbi:hypothetical protein RM530_17710 [Algiphilus sp. W345]|uniref:Transposase n=1 Tax=Banduia mediterranea TaxID=3075609 RepID=A0ABU2WNP7_9GAMM|nr:hypothetical protein [Algiphilus sp. W345]MDT0499183.1 hypothetical protein [Algiphilus sp. W345]